MKREVKTSSYTHTDKHTHTHSPSLQAVAVDLSKCVFVLQNTNGHWCSPEILSDPCTHTNTHSLSLIHIPARSLRLTPPTLFSPSVLHLFCLSAFFCSIFPAFFSALPHLSLLLFSLSGDVLLLAENSPEQRYKDLVIERWWFKDWILPYTTKLFSSGWNTSVAELDPPTKP